MYEGSFPAKGFTRWMTQFESWLVGLRKLIVLSGEKIEKTDLGYIYKLWRSQRKVKHMEALVGRERFRESH